MIFEELAELEPKLKRLYWVAGMVRDDNSTPSFCANALWYDLLKPRMYDLVGWGRSEAQNRRQQQGERARAEGMNWVSYPTKDDSKILHTPEAYDVVYHALYELLPSCHDCGCL